MSCLTRIHVRRLLQLKIPRLLKFQTKMRLVKMLYETSLM
ncbi:hypothetical protein L917_01288 [Phytophthora nicotianae]|uniref:Uncharacterized protein n=1 Tax=Phytophthora nicotianae TaxID=4792 RepID=W2HKI9_PHYNI|nr:hypothetical protein L915_01332 [Phytophthora nicotianae]ETL49157.1 hypothetical protein L916_01307 [Phytophthora nicotianae]ETM02202.1 hypothetical protein L917_01288 [Phytophthora nicotianae]